MATPDFLGGRLDIPGRLSAWPAVVFGWPAALAAIASFAAAVTLRRTRWAVAGATLAAPFCVFVSGYPAIRGIGLFVLTLTALGALAVRRGRTWLGAGLFAPFVILVAVVAAAVALSAYRGGP